MKKARAIVRLQALRADTQELSLHFFQSLPEDAQHDYMQFGCVLTPMFSERSVISVFEMFIGHLNERGIKTLPTPIKDTRGSAGRKQGPTSTQDGEGGADKRQVTPLVKERACLFKRLKDAHPNWTYDRVATQAMEEVCRQLGDAHPNLNDDQIGIKAVEKLGGNISGETVRNAYRAMREAYPDQADEWEWTDSRGIR